MSPELLSEFGIPLPPTQEDLPYDDGIPMETQRHRDQLELLIAPLMPWLEAREEGYIGGNMFVYFSPDQVRDSDYRGPDFFAVLGVPKGERKSWVVWEEEKAPDIVIELLSSSTAKRDKTEKKEIYRQKLRVSEYFWYDPFDCEDWSGFSLQGGQYDAIATNERGEKISRSLELALVRWQGSYKDVNTTWLRWAEIGGELLPLPEEIAVLARERAEQERERAERAEREREQAIPKLLALGLSAEQVAEALNLPLEAIAPFVKNGNP